MCQEAINTSVLRKGIEGETRMGHFVIHLEEINGEGEFLCPRCGVIISPDDDSGKVYDILEIAETQGLLQKVTIECKKCGSVINLEGFEALKEIKGK
jgi:DNA-directed RNA polymerase subunit RPC12/RpoP